MLSRNSGGIRIGLTFDPRSVGEGHEITFAPSAWHLGVHGLPRERLRTDFNIANQKNAESWYIRDQYGGVIGVQSTRFSGANASNIQEHASSFRTTESSFT